MKIFTDSFSFARTFFSETPDWQPVSKEKSGIAPELKTLSAKIFSSRSFYEGKIKNNDKWQAAFFVERSDHSHYDLLVKLSQSAQSLGSRIVCLAGSGSKCHGQRGRPWLALPGNLHLTVSFSPQAKIKGFGSGFPALAAVSVIEAFDELKSLRKKASIKWVNDVLIEGAKVAGFLAHSQSKDSVVGSAILGIGVNVHRAPEIKPDPFVPKAAALSSFSRVKEDLSLQKILWGLLDRLHENFNLLLKEGSGPLVDVYRTRSAVMGRKVIVFSDPLEGDPEIIAKGKVIRIGDNLELYLEGEKTPVTRGRLVLE